MFNKLSRVISWLQVEDRTPVRLETTKRLLGLNVFLLCSYAALIAQKVFILGFLIIARMSCYDILSLWKLHCRASLLLSISLLFLTDCKCFWLPRSRMGLQLLRAHHLQPWRVNGLTWRRVAHYQWRVLTTEV